jgi:hypothetical protein
MIMLKHFYSPGFTVHFYTPSSLRLAGDPFFTHIKPHDLLGPRIKSPQVCGFTYEDQISRYSVSHASSYYFLC